jgi:nucleoside-diphosphate-sugar epimerase
MKVFVTGGSGLVGSTGIDHLVARGDAMLAIKIRFTPLDGIVATGSRAAAPICAPGNARDRGRRGRPCLQR